jgi:release factor glutamine methyltransferase
VTGRISIDADDRPDSPHLETFQPTVPDAYAERIRRWHERAYRGMQDRDELEIDYLGVRLVVPSEVFAPTPLSGMFGRRVLAEVRPDDRVLDMGTGSGSNALLAATSASDVVAVDINPAAVACASRNAEANGLAARVSCRESDVFDAVDGRFDLILFDPPFRWFPPRDLLEAAITDENYTALTRFMREVPDRLNDGGRVLLSFGTSADLGYLLSLIDRSGLTNEQVDEHTLDKDGWTVDYLVYRLTKDAADGEAVEPSRAAPPS